MSATAQQLQRIVEVTEQDLPLECPMPSTPVWNLHPRVFLDVARSGELLCPYCGTRYVYKGTPPKSGH